MNNVVVTGGCGFIGSNFVNELFNRYPKIRVTVIDRLSTGGEVGNLVSNKKLKILFQDVRDCPITCLPSKIDCIFHFAAESHVDRSILTPESFVTDNVESMTSVLEWAKEKNIKLVNISTDEVYGSIDKSSRRPKEDGALEPNSPYSASKAACDLLCRSYIKTYGMDIITTRCANNYGPNQYGEKFIPVIVQNILNGLDIPVYGSGMQVREWMPVNAHIDTVLKIATSVDRGIYNICGGYSLRNIDLVNIICDICKRKGYDIPDIKFVDDRKGHDYRYAMNTFYPEYITKINKATFIKYLRETINYYIVVYERKKVKFTNKV